MLSYHSAALAFAQPSVQRKPPHLKLQSASPRVYVCVVTLWQSVRSRHFSGAAVKPLAIKMEFCYGLPGSIAPLGEFDPLNLLEGKSKEQVSSSLRLRAATSRLHSKSLKAVDHGRFTTCRAGADVA